MNQEIRIQLIRLAKRYPEAGLICRVPITFGGKPDGYLWVKVNKAERAIPGVNTAQRHAFTRVDVETLDGSYQWTDWNSDGYPIPVISTTYRAPATRDFAEIRGGVVRYWGTPGENTQRLEARPDVIYMPDWLDVFGEAVMRQQELRNEDMNRLDTAVRYKKALLGYEQAAI